MFRPISFQYPDSYWNLPKNKEKNDCIPSPLALNSPPRELEIAVGPPQICQQSILDDPRIPARRRVTR